jgi:hypothetical protein
MAVRTTVPRGTKSVDTDASGVEAGYSPMTTLPMLAAVMVSDKRETLNHRRRDAK